MSDAGDVRADAPGAPGLERGWERARAVIDELVDGARSAALSMADEQRRRAAEQIAGLAAAARAAAQALGGSSNVRSANCAQRTADTIDGFADAVRHRRWNDIVADAEGFARREPRLFMLSAAVLGYVAGRVLLASTETAATRTAAAAVALQAEAVEAAVSSAAGNGALIDDAQTDPAVHEMP